MDLTALPLPWIERLALALAPGEIARLQTLCRLLRDMMGADRVWRASLRHLLSPCCAAACCAAHSASALRHGTSDCATVHAGPICAKHGFQQQSATRTRGQWPWSRVWRSHLCVECCTPGSLALRATTPDGRRIINSQTVSVWLCKACMKSVQTLRTEGERNQVGFPRVRAGTHTSNLPLLAISLFCSDRWLAMNRARAHRSDSLGLAHPADPATAEEEG